MPALPGWLHRPSLRRRHIPVRGDAGSLTQLRVASDFLASLETFFEVRQGFNNLELADACILDIDASGTVSVIERVAAQA